ncbi:MAG: AAA family ATPase, partial [Aquificaceae bacterium]
MLIKLSLEDFYFIKGEELYFDKGLNVITGETGTGKSLTVSSLMFVMGEEGSYPEGTCVEVELFVDGESIFLRREVNKGRSRYYLNGRGSNKRVVEEILSSHLLLQGQNDRTKITRLDFQRDVYDRFLGVIDLRAMVERLYQEVVELDQRIRNLREKRVEREIRRRIIQEDIKEIEEVGLTPEEYRQAKKRLEEINLAEKLNLWLSQALSGLSASLEGIKATYKALRELSVFKDLREMLESLEVIRENLRDMERSLEGMVLSYSQEELDLLNSKLYRVQRLERKYGRSYEEIWDYMGKLKEELLNLEREEDPESLQEELKEKEEELERLYNLLSQKRLEGKEEFERRVKGYLESMGLE